MKAFRQRRRLPSSVAAPCESQESPFMGLRGVRTAPRLLSLPRRARYGNSPTPRGCGGSSAVGTMPHCFSGHQRLSVGLLAHNYRSRHNAYAAAHFARHVERLDRIREDELEVFGGLSALFAHGDWSCGNNARRFRQRNATGEFRAMGSTSDIDADFLLGVGGDWAKAQTPEKERADERSAPAPPRHCGTEACRCTASTWLWLSRRQGAPVLSPVFLVVLSPFPSRDARSLAACARCRRLVG